MADKTINNTTSSTTKILVVGLTTIDIINVCDHYPVEDEDMQVTFQHWVKGGNAANTSTVLSQHKNIVVNLLSCLSGKAENHFVIDQLHKSGVNLEFCPVYDNKYFPTSSCIINEKSGTRTILNCSNNFPAPRVEDFCKIDIQKYDWIHFEGRNFPAVGRMIDYVLKQRDRPIISGEMEKPKRLLDLDKYILCTVDVLFVSKDIARAKGFSSASETVQNISTDARIQAKFIICPWGEHGAAAAERLDDGWKFCQCKATNLKRVVDTLGAGDTFIAGVISSLVTGKTIKSSIEYGCLLAGRKCAQIGFDNLVLDTVT